MSNRSLQCPTCKAVFANRTRKSVHVRKGCKGAIVDFTCTDLEAVKALVLENPAPLQAAASLGVGVLHMELCRATHFGTLHWNHNVLSVQCKGTQMRVVDDGRPMQWLKRVGLGQILVNNLAILNDERVRPLFSQFGCYAPAATRTDIEIAVHHKGSYPMHAHVSKLTPPARTPAERPEDTPAFDSALKWADNLSEAQTIALLMSEAVKLRLISYGDRWWIRTGRTGWCHGVQRASIVEDTIREVLEDVCTRARAESPVTKERAMHVEDVLAAARRLHIAHVAELITGSLTTTASSCEHTS
jgi:hypothetical protein